MEIPRIWRLKKQRIAFQDLVTNPVIRLGMKGAISNSTEKQQVELEPVRKLIQKEESVNCLRPPQKKSIVIFSSSR